MRFTSFLLFFIPISIYPQIEVKFYLEMDRKSGIISIKNTSQEKYIFPLETTNLGTYWDGDIICKYFKEYHKPSHGLSFKLRIKDVTTNKFIEPISSFPDLAVEAIENHLKSNKDCYNYSYETQIQNWQNLYKIEDKKKAEINYYIFNNLILLQPNEQIKFRVLTDMSNISNELYFQYEYKLDESRIYNYELYTEINECIYDKLTSEQKAQFKDYKFYFGNLKSNVTTCSSL